MRGAIGKHMAHSGNALTASEKNRTITAARRKEKIMKKRILDVACGSKMFWFDKHNPDVEFCDKKVVPYHEYYKNMKPSEGDA